MTYKNRFYDLEKNISRIIEQEYKEWKVLEPRTVRELLDRIKCRVRNSFNCVILNEENS